MLYQLGIDTVSVGGVFEGEVVTLLRETDLQPQVLLLVPPPVETPDLGETDPADWVGVQVESGLEVEGLVGHEQQAIERHHRQNAAHSQGCHYRLLRDRPQVAQVE